MAASKNSEREAREARERLRRYNARQTVHAHQTSRRRRDNLVAIGAVVIVAALATVTQIFYFNGGPGTPTPEPTASASADSGFDQSNVGDVPDPDLADNRVWTGELTINDVALGIALDGSLAPQAVSSFIVSAQDGYYIDKTCHRLVQSETAGLLQCGSLDGTGATDTTYSFGPIENPGVGGLYPAGTIAMARASGDAYSNGRQFFIVFQDSVLPDDTAGGYSIIGQITSGLDALSAAVAAPGVVDGAQDGAPVVPTRITGLTIQ